jgi:alkylation response protein AidB-like acyl-CoA dehydrogenase
LVTLGLSDEGVHELYPAGHATVMAGTAVQGGGEAVPVEGGYRISGHWTFGTGCQEAAWMLGSFQILDDGKPRTRPDGGPLFWRAVFPRAEVEVVPGSWDVAGLRGTGSFDWTVKDLFLPEHRTMVHAGMPVDNQWSRWPGLTYALPSVCWVGPHHSSVITGIARAGIDALVALALEKVPRGRSFRLCDNPQVQEAVGRADSILNAGRAYRTALITELWNTVVTGHDTTLEQRARCRLASTYAGESAREAMEQVYRHGGTTGFKRASRLAECWRDLHVVGQTVTIGPEWYPIGGRALMGMDPGSRLR